MNAEGGTKKPFSADPVASVSSAPLQQKKGRWNKEPKITVFTPTETIRVLFGPEPVHVKSTTLNWKIYQLKKWAGAHGPAKDPSVRGLARRRVGTMLGSNSISRNRDIFLFSNSHPWEEQNFPTTRHMTRCPMERSSGNSLRPDPGHGWEHSFFHFNLFS